MKKKHRKTEIADGLIQTLWLAFCGRIYPAPPEPDTPQYTAMRKCFFSGALAIVSAMDRVCSSGDDLAVAFTSQHVRAELQEFLEQAEREVTQRIAESN